MIFLSNVYAGSKLHLLCSVGQKVMREIGGTATTSGSFSGQSHHHSEPWFPHLENKSSVLNGQKGPFNSPKNYILRNKML